MTIPYIIGQIIGISAMALFFLSYQAKEQKKLLFIQNIGVAAMCTHFLLIGATTGLALNVVCFIRNACYANRHRKLLSGKWVPYFFAVVIAVFGIYSWQDYYSIFILVGLVINTLCLALPDTQKLRYSILITSPLVIIYDVFVLSIGGIAIESISILSALIGIIRTKKQKKSADL